MIKTIASGILCIVALGACGADKTVVNKDLGFELTLPVAWIWNEKPADGSAPRGESQIAAGGKGSAILNASAHELKEGEALKTFVDEAIRDSGRKLKNYELIEKTEVKIGDVDAVKFTFSYDSAKDNLRCQCAAYAVLSGKRVLLFRAGALKSDFELYAKDIDGIIKSLKLVRNEK